MAALHLYVRILVVLLALAGVAALAGLQAGWLVPAASDLSRGPDDRDGENIADNSGLDNAVTGPTKVQSQLIPVDTSLTYQISAEVRAFSPEDDLMAGTRIHFESKPTMPRCGCYVRVLEELTATAAPSTACCSRSAAG